MIIRKHIHGYHSEYSEDIVNQLHKIWAHFRREYMEKRYNNFPIDGANASGMW